MNSQAQNKRVGKRLFAFERLKLEEINSIVERVATVGKRLFAFERLKPEWGDQTLTHIAWERGFSRLSDGNPTSLSQLRSPDHVGKRFFAIERLKRIYKELADFDGTSGKEVFRDRAIETIEDNAFPQIEQSGKEVFRDRAIETSFRSSLSQNLYCGKEVFRDRAIETLIDKTD